MARKKNKAEPVPEGKPKETAVEFLGSMAAVLATGLFIVTFVVQTFAIPSSSMENTLLVGDHLFVNRLQFAPKSSWLGPLLPYSDIRHGDIVAVSYTHLDVYKRQPPDRTMPLCKFPEEAATPARET